MTVAVDGSGLRSGPRDDVSRVAAFGRRLASGCRNTPRRATSSGKWARRADAEGYCRALTRAPSSGGESSGFSQGRRAHAEVPRAARDLRPSDCGAGPVRHRAPTRSPGGSARARRRSPRRRSLDGRWGRIHDAPGRETADRPRARRPGWDRGEEIRRARAESGLPSPAASARTEYERTLSPCSSSAALPAPSERALARASRKLRSSASSDSRSRSAGPAAWTSGVWP